MLTLVRCLTSRILTLVLTGLSFAMTISGVKAQNLSQVHLSLKLENASLAQALAEISAKSGVPFSYNPKKIPVDDAVNYTAENKSLVSILDDFASQFGMKYMLVENQIVLKPESKPEKQVPVTATLSGYLKDERTGEALIGATIYLTEIANGTLTNAFGFYSITVPKGIYNVQYSYLGFKEVNRTVDLNTSVNAEVIMVEEAPLLQEVIVVDVPGEETINEVQMGKMNVPAQTVEQRPAFFGETDVIKSLESVPGVKMHGDGSTFYYVRGGNKDQNLILIDDAPIYNPSHMLGLFSTIIPDAVNVINLYKGNMPASFGGRLSSVLDIRTKKGNDQHLQAWGDFGLISTKLGIEGPIRKNSTSFLVATRFSRVRWFFRQLNENVTKFNFVDFTSKLNIKINNANRVYFSFYTAGDNYFGRNNGISWTNNAATLRWNHLFSDRVFLNTTLAASGYDYFVHTDVSANTKWHSHIGNVNFKTDFTYFVRPDNALTFGSGLTAYGFNPGNLQSDRPTASMPFVSVRNSVEFVLYGNHELSLSEKWSLNYGLRLSAWTNNGEAIEYMFDENRNVTDTLHFAEGERYKSYLNAEPRLTVSYLTGENASVKASYARNVQNIHLISNSISPFTSLEVWLPSSINIKPELADQLTVGYYRGLPQRGLTLSAEVYYKKMRNQIDYESHAETLLNPLVERELRFGSTTAYGTELLARKNTGRLTGWTGYAFSKSKNKFRDINEGKVYDASYDRPHQFNVMLSYDLNLRWNVATNWIYATGSTYSEPVSFYNFNGLEVPVYGQKNNARLPDYHRLDFSANVKLNRNPEKKYQHTLTFSLYNVYGRRNPVFINYHKTQDNNGDFKIPADLYDANRVTTQYYLFTFIPSVTYGFKWR